LEKSLLIMVAVEPMLEESMEKPSVSYDLPRHKPSVNKKADVKGRVDKSKVGK
jgi:hypothetical protein